MMGPHLKNSLLQHDETVVSSASRQEQQGLGSGGAKLEGYIGAALGISERKGYIAGSVKGG